MEFLPLEINNEKVYAGFWKRFGAGIVANKQGHTP
jgi:hypothetical protein